MTKPIRHWLQLALFPWLLAACVVSPSRLPPGELGRKFSATVPGTWSGEIWQGENSCRTIKQFNPDGTARGVLLMKTRATGISFVLPEVPFTSRWRIVGDVYETYDIKTGIPGAFKSREVIRDTILSVTPNRITTRANSSGKTETIERLTSSR